MGCDKTSKDRWVYHRKRMLNTKIQRIGSMEKKFQERWGLSRFATNLRVEIEWPSSQKMLDWKLEKLGKIKGSEILTKGQIYANLEVQRNFKEARSEINLEIRQLDFTFCM